MVEAGSAGEFYQATLPTSAVPGHIPCAMDVQIVIPGDRLGSLHEFLSGEGTYARDGHVYAAVVGVKAQDASDTGDSKPVLRVQRQAAVSSAPHIPEVGSVVTARVVSINARAATVQIVCIDGEATAHPFSGTIRKENTVATDIDRISMEHIVRPGDVVIAEVRCSF